MSITKLKWRWYRRGEGVSDDDALAQYGRVITGMLTRDDPGGPEPDHRTTTRASGDGRSRASPFARR